MIKFKYRHRNFVSFVKFIEEHERIFELRNELAEFAGGIPGMDMSILYADIYKTLYDFFMKPSTQEKLIKKWRTNKERWSWSKIKGD